MGFAEDLVSDVLRSVVQKLSDFHWRYPGSFRAWIFQIARRKLIDYYRRNPATKETLDENDAVPDSSSTQIYRLYTARCEWEF